MRIAAGVLLILVSLVNGCMGAGVTLMGGMATAVSQVAEEVADDADLNAEMTEEERAAFKATMGETKSAGGLIALVGMALLALFGLQIAAAVCLFATKASKFVLVVGILGIPIPVLFMVQAEGSVFMLACAAVSALAAFAGYKMGQEGSGASAPPPPAAA